MKRRGTVCSTKALTTIMNALGVSVQSKVLITVIRASVPTVLILSFITLE
jgi:hypothetical protein